MDEEDQIQVGYARRYRPMDFEGYISNYKLKETVYRTLKQSPNVWPQTIELTGNTGCGKTTMARIIVREYMCENRDPDVGACGECTSCEYMEEYIKTGNNEYLMDLEEIDITQKSGKDDIMELMESMQIPPQAGDWKVYYFDEFHQASQAAQSSLLKVIEEPPENVLLIFATTDPEKVKDTIRNRMILKLRVERPKTKELIAHLATICKTEGVVYDVSGLRMICLMSGNVIRDSLNYLEQVVKNQSEATETSISDEFDVVGDEIIHEFIQAYKDRNYLEYISILYTVTEKMSISSFLTALKQYLIRGIYVLNSVDVDGLMPDELKKYKHLFSQFSPSEVATLLANMQKVDRGDPTANLMAFIYTSEDFKSQGIAETTREITYSEDEKVAEGESKARSTNIERIRAAGSEVAEERLAREVVPVSSQDILKSFNPKPVREE